MGKEESSGPSNKCTTRQIALEMVLQNDTTLECTATFLKFSAQLQNQICLKDAIFCCSDLFRNIYVTANMDNQDN